MAASAADGDPITVERMAAIRVSAVNLAAISSVLAMILFCYGVAFGNLVDSPQLQGLKIVAATVVAQVVWGMTRRLCSDRERATIVIGAAMVVLRFPRLHVKAIVT